MPSGSIILSTPSASSTDQAPFASTRIRASGPTRSRTARTTATSSPAPSLSLKVSKPRVRPALGVRGHRLRVAGDEGRVAADRRGRVGAEQRPERPARRLAREVEDRHLDRRLGRGRQAPAGDRVDEGVDRREQRLLAGEVGEVGPAQPARALAQRALDRRQVGAAAQRERHGLAESDQARVRDQPQEQHLAPLERAAGGGVRALERERVRDHLDLDELHLRGDQQPQRDEEAEGAEQGSGAGEGAVEGRAVGALEDRPQRLDRKRGGEDADQRQERPVRRDQTDRQDDEGPADARLVDDPGALAAEADGERALARRGGPCRCRGCC